MTGSASAIAMHLEEVGWRAGMCHQEICAGAAGRLTTSGTHQRPRDTYFIGSLRPAQQRRPAAQPQRLRSSAEQDCTTAFGVERSRCPTDRAHAAAITLTWACYFGVSNQGSTAGVSGVVDGANSRCIGSCGDSNDTGSSARRLAEVTTPPGGRRRRQKRRCGDCSLDLEDRLQCHRQRHLGSRARGQEHLVTDTSDLERACCGCLRMAAQDVAPTPPIDSLVRRSRARFALLRRCRAMMPLPSIGWSPDVPRPPWRGIVGNSARWCEATDLVVELEATNRSAVVSR